MKAYDPKIIEPKWQKRWEEEGVYEVDLSKAKKPFYTMVMFPYPSGDKLHVGHWYNFGPADSYARFIKMQGNTVFSPIGFDAFGLPAENHAVKTGIPPQISIKENVLTMTKQLHRIGCMYDWSKSVNTSHPEYYKWTQWVFLALFKKGLAYRKAAFVNYCPSCKTVLANEQVWDGRCERCESEVTWKPLEQWFFKITDYAERLLRGLTSLDWPEKTKLMQRNWIGRSEGVMVRSKIKGFDFEFDVFDSVPQTFCAQTFSVIAAEHPVLAKLVKGLPQEKEVLAFAERIKKKKLAGRFTMEAELEGIFTGRFVDDPFGTGDLPLWVASFVVMEYGSGIVHCSAHDERDFAFAKKYGIPLRPVMFPKDPTEAKRVRNLEYCYAKDPEGILTQPEEFRGRKWGQAREDIIRHMEKRGLAKRTVQYRIRDWLISRQRYWGAPIPIVYDPGGQPHAVPTKHLPWLLPDDVDFKPTGVPPLAKSKELMKRVEKIFGKGWKPEFDTMDTFVDSSFYNLLYLSASHERGNYCQLPIATSHIAERSIEQRWMPVSMYIGGAEHACMHLIYARFIHMVLKDLGHISCEEPFQRLVHQGVITNKGAKMSKSRGNVVSPDSFIERYGSDVFRMYLMFMGPFTQGGDWSDSGIKGIDRFVQKVFRVVSTHMNKIYDQKKTQKKAKSPIRILSKESAQESASFLASLHATIKKVGEDIERLHFNTAVSALMEFVSVLEKEPALSLHSLQSFIKLLAPLAPHLSEELWEKSGGKGFVCKESWPSYDPKWLSVKSLTIAIQVNGKVRGTIMVEAGLSEGDVLAQAQEHPNVKKYLREGKVKNAIVIPGRLVSIVTEGS